MRGPLGRAAACFFVLALGAYLSLCCSLLMNFAKKHVKRVPTHQPFISRSISRSLPRLGTPCLPLPAGKR
jgi:hypothetical protein